MSTLLILPECNHNEIVHQNWACADESTTRLV
jgi:hypothetical protein